MVGSIRSEIVLPTDRRFVLDGVRECKGIGSAGEPTELDRDIECTELVALGKRHADGSSSGRLFSVSIGCTVRGDAGMLEPYRLAIESSDPLAARRGPIPLRPAFEGWPFCSLASLDRGATAVLADSPDLTLSAAECQLAFDISDTADDGSAK